MKQNDIENNIEYIRLGLNIDHVATIRNARGGDFPCPVRAALLAEQAGVDGITAHLREDRRHIRDDDIFRIRQEVNLPLNMEMAATDEMLKIALSVQPNACCIVPEKREELTTEGGLNAAMNIENLTELTKELHQKNIKVSLFLDSDEAQILAAKKIGADIVELHTGIFCNHYLKNNVTGVEMELKKLRNAAKLMEKIGLECHAGHGLNFNTTKYMVEIPSIKELNIGHFIIGESIFDGLNIVIAKMRNIIDGN